MDLDRARVEAGRGDGVGEIRYGLAILILWAVVAYGLFGDKPSLTRQLSPQAVADCRPACLK